MDLKNIKNLDDIRKYIKNINNIKDIRDIKEKEIDQMHEAINNSVDYKKEDDSNINVKDLIIVKELLHNYLSGWQARNESQYTVLIHLLDTLTKHQEKLNSKVATHEKRLNDFLLSAEVNKTKSSEYRNTRSETCPHLDDIQGIKTDQITEKKAKSMFYKGIAIFASIIGTIWIIFQGILLLTGG